MGCARPPPPPFGICSRFLACTPPPPLKNLGYATVLIISFSASQVLPAGEDAAIDVDQIDNEIDTRDAAAYVDNPAEHVAVPLKTEQPDTPQSAPPSLKRPKILRKPAPTPTPPPVLKPEPDIRGTDLFALKRELFLEEHEAKMAALADEKALKAEAIAEERRLKSELFEWEIRAAKSKDEYYRAKIEAMQSRNLQAFGAGILPPVGLPYSGYHSYPPPSLSGQPCGAIENSFPRPGSYPQLATGARNPPGHSWNGSAVSDRNEQLYTFEEDGKK